MGCDIHMYAEVLNTKTKKWEKVGAVFDSMYEWSEEKVEHPYEGRNYELFTILAGVRNYNKKVVVISEPRNLPHDVSDEVKEISDGWGCDGHSHSYFTLKELLDFNWEQEMTLQGFVDPGSYKYYKEHGEPCSWCQGTTAEIISIEDMEKLVAGISEETWKQYHPAIGFFKTDDKSLYKAVKLTWTKPLHTEAGLFYTKTLPRLKELGKPENVRIVFWFDN